MCIKGDKKLKAPLSSEQIESWLSEVVNELYGEQRTDSMSIESPKKIAIKTIKNLPDSSTWSQIMQALSQTRDQRRDF